MNALHLHTPKKVTWMNDETFHPLKVLCSNEHCQFSGIKYLPFLVAKRCLLQSINIHKQLVNTHIMWISVCANINEQILLRLWATCGFRDSPEAGFPKICYAIVHVLSWYFSSCYLSSWKIDLERNILLNKEIDWKNENIGLHFVKYSIDVWTAAKTE